MTTGEMSAMYRCERREMNEGAATTVAGYTELMTVARGIDKEDRTAA